MKQVTIPVYEFNELDEPVRRRLMEQEREYVVDDNFTAFSDISEEYLAERYGIDGKTFYSLSYCQSDGLHFETDNFLTEKVLDVIKLMTPQFTENTQKILDFIFGLSAKICTKHSNTRYEYASISDVQYSDEESLIEEVTAKFNLTELASEEALAEILDKLRAFYMSICNDLEKLGYDCYDVEEEDILVRLTGNYYYRDGRIHSSIEDNK